MRLSKSTKRLHELLASRVLVRPWQLHGVETAVLHLFVASPPYLLLRMLGILGPDTLGNTLASSPFRRTESQHEQLFEH